MQWLLGIIADYALSKKAAVGAGIASGVIGVSILAASASYTDKAVFIAAREAALKRDLILIEVNNLKTTGEDLKVGMRTVNENLILSLRNQGYNGKVKRIEFVSEKENN